jgi:hypothetical protein
MIANAGDHDGRDFLELFAAPIGNENTRMAYYRAVCSFFAGLGQYSIGELAHIEPLQVAAYLKRGDPGFATTGNRENVGSYLFKERRMSWQPHRLRTRSWSQKLTLRCSIPGFRWMSCRCRHR